MTAAYLQAFLDDQGTEFQDLVRGVWVQNFIPTQLLLVAMSHADEDPLANEFGTGLGQITTDVVAGSRPEVFELLIGSFDLAAVDEAVDADPLWSEQRETAESYGETFDSRGDDDEIQAEGRSPIRNLAISGRLWVDESIAACARSTPVVESLLAGCSGAAPTLADDEAYAGIAARLDEFEGSFNAALVHDRSHGGSIPGPRRKVIVEDRRAPLSLDQAVRVHGHVAEHEADAIVVLEPEPTVGPGAVLATGRGRYRSRGGGRRVAQRRARAAMMRQGLVREPVRRRRWAKGSWGWHSDGTGRPKQTTSDGRKPG